MCRAQDISGPDRQTKSFVCLLSNQKNAPGFGSTGPESACRFGDTETSEQCSDPRWDRGGGAASVLEAPGKETAREETAPGKEKRKKRKKKQAERWFSEKSLSDRGGMVGGAHNSGVLGHPPPRLSSLWPSPLVLRCEGSGGSLCRVLAAAGC